MNNTVDLFAQEELPVPKAPVKSAPLQAATEAFTASVPAAVTTVSAAAAPQASAKALAERKTPEGWVRFLSSVPEPFRAPVLANAWSVYDDVLAMTMQDDTRFKGHERNSAVTTAICSLSYAAFLPFHLVKPAQMSQALELLGQDPHSFAKWIKSENPGADRLLIVGDSIKPEELVQVLDEQLSRNPARALLCGPGKSVEATLRGYADERHYVRANVMSVDPDANGSNWEQVPGPRLEKLVERVFRELKPDRVIAFDPARMPASIQVLEKARQMGIPVFYPGGPDLIGTAATTAYAKPGR